MSTGNVRRGRPSGRPGAGRPEGRPLRSLLLRSLLLALVVCASAVPLLAQPRDPRLIDAVKRRDDKAFAALLRAKVDVDAAQPDGATPLAWAVHLGERR